MVEIKLRGAKTRPIFAGSVQIEFKAISAVGTSPPRPGVFMIEAWKKDLGKILAWRRGRRAVERRFQGDP
jgi:hypothetical protein